MKLYKMLEIKLVHQATATLAAETMMVVTLAVKENFLQTIKLQIQ